MVNESVCVVPAVKLVVTAALVRESVPKTAPVPVGCVLAMASVTVAGVVSRPKLGVAAPPLFFTVTEGKRSVPALVTADGTPDTVTDAGTAMKEVLPDMLNPASEPVPVYVAVTVICPTSAYCKLGDAVPVASKLRFMLRPTPSHAAAVLLALFNATPPTLTGKVPVVGLA